MGGEMAAIGGLSRHGVFQKSDGVSLNSSNAMKATHAAVTITPIGMVATISAFRTIYISREAKPRPLDKMRPNF